jgi:hypothetical protein
MTHASLPLRKLLPPWEYDRQQPPIGATMTTPANTIRTFYATVDDPAKTGDSENHDPVPDWTVGNLGRGVGRHRIVVVAELSN